MGPATEGVWGISAKRSWMVCCRQNEQDARQCMWDRSVSGMRTRVTTTPYLALATGSIPLFLIASAASGEAKNAINRLALSTSPEPATMAAENT